MKKIRRESVGRTTQQKMGLALQQWNKNTLPHAAVAIVASAGSYQSRESMNPATRTFRKVLVVEQQSKIHKSKTIIVFCASAISGSRLPKMAFATLLNIVL